MAEEPTPTGGGPDAPRKRAAREKLIVGGTIALVVLTYLIYRRSQAASAATTSTAATPIFAGYPGSFATGAYGSGNSATPVASTSVQTTTPPPATSSGSPATGNPTGILNPSTGPVVPGAITASAPGPAVYGPAGDYSFMIGPGTGPTGQWIPGNAVIPGVGITSDQLRASLAAQGIH